ncbi:hypothetical protein EZV62_013862 [Acer yangbiense]|uniref:F-box domain-containing protein n=1 Tax=Acer yangbiense TaxID=1000413 RepID=A0A5C7HR46_9ROSI|nr:hypothetical protein EZV62_013862 [Acer yangbiense]
MDCERLGKRYNKGEDILSRLPDDVLSHIFSRLEAKDAVKTSVLSSRFKDVWTLIYNLRFEFTRVGYEGNRGTSFANFVESVLRHCQSNIIQNFHGTYYYLLESEVACLTELICFVVGRNVCSLKLKFDVLVLRPMIRLPQSILTCKSLVRLSLGFCDFVLDIPDCMVCFPCLKFLSIFVNSPNSNLMQKLFRSCPILEELKIKGYRIENEDVLTFDINVPTLKKLKVYLRGHREDEYDDISEHKFVVRARNLEYLNVCNYFLACFVLGETPFLNKVILDTKDSTRFSVQPPNNEETKRTAEFFRAISSTRFLSLDNILISELYHDRYGTLPSFPNLIYLCLGVDIPSGFAPVVQFLINSPNLEVLVLGKEYVYDKDEVVLPELECVPSCMSLHLKEIYLFSVVTYGQGLEVIKWLLENSKVLERFSFHTTLESIEDEQEMENEILNLPRASPICEIELGLYCGGKKMLQSEFHICRESFCNAAFRL